MAEKDKGEDENQHLRNRIAVLEAKLEHWQKFAGTLCDLLRRVGSDRMSPEDARVRLQAAVEGRLTVAPVADRAASAHSDRDRNERIADAQGKIACGQIQRAIEIYVGLCEQYPDETRFRLKLGDCYARVGDITKAAATFLVIAQHYDAQGFFLKAAAVYKQVLKMDERQPEGAGLPRKTIADVHYALAKVYDRLNLREDALSQYEECYRLTDEGDGALSSLGEEIARHGGNPQGLHD